MAKTSGGKPRTSRVVASTSGDEFMFGTGPDIPITRVDLQGFKSHRGCVQVRLAKLTLVAGENSAGKSSVIQPLLLLKQTLEAPHLPDVLELSGPCVRIDRARELLWNGPEPVDAWKVRIHHEHASVELEYSRPSSALPTNNQLGIHLRSTTFRHRDGEVEIQDGSSWERDALSTLFKTLPRAGRYPGMRIPLRLLQDFASKAVADRVRGAHIIKMGVRFNETDEWGLSPFALFDPMAMTTPALLDLIHLPGLRGNPERTYRVLGITERFPGNFPGYSASLLHHWRKTDPQKVNLVQEDLRTLGLTAYVETNQVDDARVELKLGRTLSSTIDDLVNIADVGFGASQAIPVVVALHAAKQNQLVHIEQPELHLHPNAQVALAQVFVRALSRGVRLIIETHSAVLLRALQVEVARGENLRHEDVALHWFSRDENGVSTHTEAKLKSDGSYGDWPVNFAKVEMDVMRAYLQAQSPSRART